MLALLLSPVWQKEGIPGIKRMLFDGPHREGLLSHLLLNGDTWSILNNILVL
jgi:hypothetical protein